MISNREKDFFDFSSKVLDHIAFYTVLQYGDAPNDQVENWTPEQCVKQIGKYVARFESNQRGEKEKLLDLIKIAHYAGIAYIKENNGKKS
jgi:hypothetical protein